MPHNKTLQTDAPLATLTVRRLARSLNVRFFDFSSIGNDWKWPTAAGQGTWADLSPLTSSKRPKADTEQFRFQQSNAALALTEVRKKSDQVLDGIITAGAWILALIALAYIAIPEGDVYSGEPFVPIFLAAILLVYIVRHFRALEGSPGARLAQKW